MHKNRDEDSRSQVFQGVYSKVPSLGNLEHVRTPASPVIQMNSKFERDHLQYRYRCLESKCDICTASTCMQNKC